MVSVVCVLPELNKKFLKIVPIQGSRNSDLIYRSSAQPRAWHPQALTQVHPPYPHWQNSPESYDPNLLAPLLISTTTGSRPGLHASSQGLQSLPSHRSWRRHVCRFLGVLGTALHPRASEQLGAAALQVTLPKHRSQENVLCSVMICHLTWHQSASQTHLQQPPCPGERGPQGDQKLNFLQLFIRAMSHLVDWNRVVPSWSLSNINSKKTEVCRCLKSIHNQGSPWNGNSTPPFLQLQE